MNLDDEISDHDVLRAAARSLSTLPAAAAPDVRTVMARGGARRRRQLAGLGVAGAAVVTMTTLGLTGVLASGAAPPSATTGTIHTAAFTLSKNSDGTATLRLTMAQVFDPQALQRALAEDGIPAVVTRNSWCSSSPAPPSLRSLGVLSVQTPNGTPAPPVARSGHRRIPPGSVTVINPAKLPRGTELVFDYIRHAPRVALAPGIVYAHSYTCVNGAGPTVPGQ